MAGAVVVGILLALLPSAPSVSNAQEEDRYSIFLRRVICDIETSGGGSDEVYAKIAIADVNPASPSTLKFTGTGVLGSLDSGETRDESSPRWHRKVPSPLWSGSIPDPNRLLVLIVLMEEDGYGIGHAGRVMREAFDEGLVSYARTGSSRSEIVDNLTRDYRSKWTAVSRDAPFTEDVDNIIDIRELAFTSSDLETFTAPLSRIVEFRGHGGRYRLVFELVKSTSIRGGRTATAPVVSSIMRVDAMTPREGPPGTVVYIDGVNFGASGSLVMRGPGGSFTMGIRGWSSGAISAVVPDRTPTGDYNIIFTPRDAYWTAGVSRVFHVTARR